MGGYAYMQLFIRRSAQHLNGVACSADNIEDFTGGFQVASAGIREIELLTVSEKQGHIHSFFQFCQIAAQCLLGHIQVT